MATQKLNLTRDQLATFLKNHEQIKQFERLFQIADEVAPASDTQGISIQTGNADAAANEALAQLVRLAQDASINSGAADQKAVQALDTLGRIANALEALATAPVIQNNNSVVTDYIDLNAAAPNVDRIRRLAWNDVDQTADLCMDYGVVQQIGLEYYARVENATGVTIPNGTVVGFAGVGSGNVLSVVPYLADGSQPSLYILGVMTHDLPNSGEVGYCTVWGHVRGLDTSALSVGDVLYASPAIAGGFTNVKPTAPDHVIPVAAVLEVDAANGEIFVRPIVEQEQYYGVFSDSTTQTPAAIYTPYAITFNTTDIANGVSRGTPTSRIVVSDSGLYRFEFSLQIETSNAASKKVWIWPRVNGVDVPNSNSEVSIAGSGTTLVPAWSWVLSLAANDYFQIMYAVEDLAITISAKAAKTGAAGTATFARPAAPSIILEVTQVQQ